MASVRLALARAIAAAPRAVPRPVVRARPGVAGLRLAFSRVRMYSDETGASRSGEASAGAAAEKSAEAGAETGVEEGHEQGTKEASAETGAEKSPDADAETDAQKLERQRLEEARAEDRAEGLAENEGNMAQQLEKKAEYRRRMGLDISKEKAAEMGIDNCAFYLSNVPFSMTPHEVIQEADGLDGVVSVSVIPDAVGKFQFFFKDTASMIEAFEKVHRSELRGRIIKANRYVPGVSINPPSDSIFFTGVPEDATDAELDAVFAGLENTKRIDVLRGSGLNALYRGYGFARFPSIAAAIEGYKVLLRKSIRGEKVRCDFAKLTGENLQESIDEKKKKKRKRRRSLPLIDATPEERKLIKDQMKDESRKRFGKHKNAEEGGRKGWGKVKSGEAGEVQSTNRKADKLQDTMSENARQTSEIQDLSREMTRQADETQDVIKELAQEADATEGASEETDQTKGELQALKTKMAKQAEELQAMKEKMSDLETQGQQNTEG